jgi:cysteine sulfinate desulfinase/cysteine desulfurase-like protein
LRAIGLTDEASRASVRFSLGRGTTEQDIDRTLAALKACL